MKIGIITDVHNNVIALNSMLKLFEKNECDEIIYCGDIIGIGPFPEETVQGIKSTLTVAR
ncbi:metallophosphoesterase family protein [Clostridium intestinale]|nr:metallophosphoesterase family protein [Clostridium intestinale]